MTDAKLITMPLRAASGKSTLIILALLALGLFLQGIMLSDLYLYLVSMDAQLCDLRRKLGQISFTGRDMKLTGTISVAPAPSPPAPVPRRDFETENT